MSVVNDDECDRIFDFIDDISDGVWLLVVSFVEGVVVAGSLLFVDDDKLKKCFSINWFILCETPFLR